MYWSLFLCDHLLPNYTIIFTYIHLITYLATSSTHLNEKQFIYIYIIHLYLCILIYISFFTSSRSLYVFLPSLSSPSPHPEGSIARANSDLPRQLSRWPAHKNTPLVVPMVFFGKKTRCKFVGNYEISEISTVFGVKNYHYKSKYPGDSF